MVNLPGLAGTPPAGRCLVMGVVNVTPDSFSDGGRWFGAADAIEHGLRMVAEGADIVDVGGESTRPGAQRVPADEELRRVKPVITELVGAGVVVSVDTMRAQVAEWALEAGVSLVNDVSGGLADPYMPRLVAKAGVPYVVVHWRGHSHDMYSRAVYADVVREVHDELAQRVGAVIAEGVDPSMIVLDPGLGFSKNPAPVGPDAHNWQLRGRPARAGQDRRPRLPGPGRRVPQAVPEQAVRRGGGRAAAVHGERRGDGRDHRAVGGGRRLVRPRPPGPGERGRGPGRRRLPGCPPMTAVVLALGSNLGDRQDILQGAVDAIVGLPGVRVTAVSPVYETVPVGGPAQPDYLNAVVLADAARPARELLDRLHEIEAAFDRVRLVRWGPRTLDIDVIDFGGERSDDPELTLPHPRAHERAFVLAPWHDVDPDAALPGRGPVAELLAKADRSGLRRSNLSLVIPEGMP